MDDNDVEQEYDSEADFYAEDEEESEEIEEEESEADKEEDEETEQNEIEFLEEEEEARREKKEESMVKKINELDKNHIIIKIIPKHSRRSSHILQYSEMIEVIGARASQIERGCTPFTDVTGLTSPIDMAKKEFIDRKNPFIIERKMKVDEGTIEVEEWEVREMTFPITDREILNTPSIST